MGNTRIQLQSPAVVESQAGFVWIQERPYRNELWIYERQGRCEWVNHVDLEQYLHGLVNAEFNSKWSPESIDAQVIAARTYALYQIQHAGVGRHYDVDATTRDQVYDGSMLEDERAAQSVNRTRGKVIVANAAHAVGSTSSKRTPASVEPKPIKAFYHSTCGGKTELPARVWGRAYEGFKRRVPCPYCVSSPRIEWQARISREELGELLLKGAQASGKPSNWPVDWVRILTRARLERAEVSRRGLDGRVERLRLTWELGRRRTIEIDAARFRDWVGPTRVKSTWFEMNAPVTVAGPAATGVRSKIEALVFEGRGNGHGVGLCQWGAKTMAEKGFRSSEILSHYYPDTTLVRLW